MADMPGHWQASWIGFDPDPRREIGFFLFRCELSLERIPQEYMVKASADNRYKLWVNGQFVGFGPQRGDLDHWFYEQYDFAPFLRAGPNEIEALVWNFGRLAPMAQISARLGFIFEAPDEDLCTKGKWRVASAKSLDFAMMNADLRTFYIDVGPGEILDSPKVAEDLEWREPTWIDWGVDRGGAGGGTPWAMIPRSIPAMKYELRDRLLEVRTGGEFPVRLEPGVPCILDARELLCAFPRVKLSGTPGGRVRLVYAEAPTGPSGKGSRDDLEDKKIVGYEDLVVLGDGPAEFEPAWWRTYRYVAVVADKPAVLARFDSMETGYPLIAESSFVSSDERVNRVWEVAVRTAQRCAGETYFDCPYYEQLQYAGDTRIQAIIGYYLSRDRRLQRNAIETLAWSAMPEGLTQSRYPTRQTQVIPPFSLWWVLMLADQNLYDSHPKALHLEIADRVLTAWREMIETLDDKCFWPFADWVPQWRWGEAPGRIHAAVQWLTEALALLEMDKIRGESRYTERAHGILAECHVGQDGLVRHRRDPSGEASEHSEALYRLACRAAGNPEPPWPSEDVMARVPPCTYYFSYYTKEALQDDGNPMRGFEAWYDMLERGLTTFAEHPEPVRSDCHAWSAHPIVTLLRDVAGVRCEAPGWRRARICPHPGRLERFEATVAHPEGDLSVDFDRGEIRVISPVPFTFDYEGKSQSFEPGIYNFR